MSDMKFTKSHEWCLAGDDLVTVGITNHAQELLGDLVFVELPETGNTVNVGEELGVIESVKAASDFYAPLSGTVVAVNDDVVSNPSLVNSDPYEAGWLVKIKPGDLDQMKDLLDSEEYEQVVAEEN